jgi:diacylglycerol kinase (ATP)
MNTSKKGFKKRIRSFGYAFSGLYELLKSEPNARIHFLATVCALIAGITLHISKLEWCVILILIALVWAAEAFNTAIEKLVDHLFQDYHETARIAKDVSAGAVLVCAMVALVCGLIIFLPKLFLLFYCWGKLWLYVNLQFTFL